MKRGSQFSSNLVNILTQLYLTTEDQDRESWLERVCSTTWTTSDPLTFRQVVEASTSCEFWTRSSCSRNLEADSSHDYKWTRWLPSLEGPDCSHLWLGSCACDRSCSDHLEGVPVPHSEDRTLHAWSNARSLPRRPEKKLKKRDGSFMVLRGLSGLVVALRTEDLVGLDRGTPVILKIEERGDLEKEDLPIYQGTYLFQNGVSTKVTDLSRTCFPNSLRAWVSEFYLDVKKIDGADTTWYTKW